MYKLTESGEGQRELSVSEFESLSLSCLPPNTDNMENVTQHEENSHYGQEGMTLKC